MHESKAPPMGQSHVTKSQLMPSGGGLNIDRRTISNVVNDDTYLCICAGNCVILQTNRARCALYQKILDLLDEESVSGARSGRASL